jgi:ribose 5-phosphate isomerase B
MLYLGADHRGFELKKNIKEYFSLKSIPFVDLGNSELDPDDDFPVFSKKVTEKVLRELESKGILICGSGIGMSMAANRFKGIRAGLCLNEDMAFSARNDDDINILILAADFIEKEKSFNIVSKFLETEFSGKERYERRISMLDN